MFPKGAHVWYQRDDGLWWLGKISASTTENKGYQVCFLDDPGTINLPLPPSRYTISAGAVRGSWCLQVHIATAFPIGIQSNVDKSRGTAVASRLLSRHRSSIGLRFVWIMKFEFCLWVVCGVLRVLIWFWGGLFNLGFVLPNPLLSAGPGFGQNAAISGAGLSRFRRCSIPPCRRPPQPRAGGRPGYPVRAQRGTELCTGL